jgi:hypothetical protein
MDEWWRRATDALHARRAELVAAALAAAEDADLQAELLQEQSRLQQSYTADLVAGLLVQQSCVLGPLHIAHVYMHCWPRCAGRGGGGGRRARRGLQPIAFGAHA